MKYYLKLPSGYVYKKHKEFCVYIWVPYSTHTLLYIHKHSKIWKKSYLKHFLLVIRISDKEYSICNNTASRASRRPEYLKSLRHRQRACYMVNTQLTATISTITIAWAQILQQNFTSFNKSLLPPMEVGGLENSVLN